MDILANRLLGMVCYAATAEALGRVGDLSPREIEELLMPLTLPLELRRPQLDESWRDRPQVVWGGQTDQLLLGVDVWATLGPRVQHFPTYYLERLTHWRSRPPSEVLPTLARELKIADNIRLRHLDVPGRDADAATDRVLMAVGRAAAQTKNYHDGLFAREVAEKYWKRTQEATAGALPRIIATALPPIPLAEKLRLAREVVRYTHADPLCVGAGLALVVLLHRTIFDGERPVRATMEGLQAGRAILDDRLLEEWDSFLHDPERIRLASLNDVAPDNHVLRALGVVVWVAFEIEQAARDYAKLLREQNEDEQNESAQNSSNDLKELVLPDAGKSILETVVLECGDVCEAAPLAGALLGAVLGYNGMPLDWLAALQGRNSLEFCARRAISRLGMKSAVQPVRVHIRRLPFCPNNLVRHAYELDGELWFHNRPCGTREELEKWARQYYRGLRESKGKFAFK